MGNPAGTHSLACEWVATRLAARMGLPTLRAAVIEFTGQPVIELYEGARLIQGRPSSPGRKTEHPGAARLRSIRPGDLRALIPGEHLRFIRGCRDYFETVGHIFVHAYYEPDRPLPQQSWNGLRWASLPLIPARHCSGKVAVVGHSPQKSGEILDLGFFKCIDTFCHGGGWLTALEVRTGRVWQADAQGRLRQA
jgi:serine/threonine protein phosphatase 1